MSLSACGGDEASESSVDEPALVVGAGEDLTPSGAFQARLGVYPLNVNVAETLTRLDRDYTVDPGLALRWEYLGRNTWRFHLRPGVLFHDGDTLRAEDVRWSLASAIDQGFGYGGLVGASVEVVDDLTVDIRTDVPDLRLPEQLVHPNLSVFAAGTDPGTRPVGTGPYRFVEYVPNRHFRVRRFDRYWEENASVAALRFRFLPDPTSRVLSLLSGEVDLALDLPREQVPAVEALSSVRVARSAAGYVMNFHVNVHGEVPYDLMRDRRLRKAIAYAIDRESLVWEVWNGEGEAGRAVSVPAVLGDAAELIEGYSHAPERARALLDEAGWRVGSTGIRRREGRPLRPVMIANPEVGTATVEYLQARLREVGIDLRWEKLPDSGTYFERLNTGQFDLNLSLSNQNDANPLFLPELVLYSGSERPFARWHHVGARFDSLVEAGTRAESPVRARRLAAEAMHVAVDEEAVVIPVAALSRLYGVASNVEGFLPHPSQTNQRWSSVRVRDGTGAKR